MKKLILAASMILLTSCGGGGSGGGDEPFYAGVYDGVIRVQINTCDIPVERETLFTHTVNQEGRRVVVDVAGGGSFAGELTEEDDGFRVMSDPSPPFMISETVACSINTGISYTQFEGDTAFVVVALVETCSDGISEFSCELASTGRAQKRL